MSRKYSTASRNRALTLIEVVAAIGILSALLVSLLSVHSKLARQSKRGALRMLAIEAADNLLSEWTSTVPMSIPSTEGVYWGKSKLYWRVEATTKPELQPYGVQVARLTVSDVPRIAATDDLPLVSVDFLANTAIARGVTDGY